MSGYTSHIHGLEYNIVNTFQTSLQIQLNLYQDFGVLFYRNGNTLYRTAKTLESQDNLKKEPQSRETQTPWLQNVLKSYDNNIKKATYSAEVQTDRPTAQTHVFRNILKAMWSTGLRQRRQDHSVRERVPGELAILGQRNDISPYLRAHKI